MRRNECIIFRDAPGSTTAAALKYRHRGDKWRLVSYKFCADGVRWSARWTRVRSYGTRQMRRWQREGVAMEFSGSEA